MIEATLDVDPGRLTTNAAKRCMCIGGKPRSRTQADHTAASDELTMKAKFAWLGESFPVFPDGPVIVEIEVTPKRIHDTGACAEGLAFMDDDAPVKAIRDALNGVAYTDDAQVKRTISEKFTRKERPVGIRVRIYRPEELETEEA